MKTFHKFLIGLALCQLLTGTIHATASIGFQERKISVAQSVGAVSIPVVLTPSAETPSAWADNNGEMYYSASDGTALDGVHYTGTGENWGEISMVSNDGNPVTSAISIPIIYTGATEDKTFAVTLHDDDYGTVLGEITTCIVTILAEPVRPPVEFSFASATHTVNQDAGSFRLSVSYTGSPRNSQVWFKYRTVDGTATSGEDYLGTTSTTVNFAGGSRTAYISVPVYMTRATNDQQFTVQMFEVSEGQLGALSTALVTIKGIPAPPPIQFKFGAAAYKVTQTAGAVRIPVTYTGTPQQSDIWVKYRTEELSAVSGTDFQGTAFGVLNFPAGTNKAYISIPVYHTGSGSSKSFHVILDDRSEGLLANPSATKITIQKEVARPRIAFDNTKGRVGPIIIRGRVLNVPTADIKRVSLTIGGKAFPVTGNSKWNTKPLAVSAPGSYLIKVTATLANGEKITKQIVFRVTR